MREPSPQTEQVAAESLLCLSRPQVGAMPHNLRIMIVEDEPFHREWLTRIARQFSCHVHAAQDGQEALQMLEHMEPPQLLLCDLNMPQMDGVTFLRHLAERRVRCAVALISAAEPDVIDSVSQMIPLYGMQLAAILRKPASRQQVCDLLENSPPAENAARRQPRAHLSAERWELLMGLAAGQFIAYFQPHIDATSRQVIGAEALVRWHHPQYGVLTPDYFLDELQAAGLAPALTQQVLEQSIRACRQWLDQGLHLTVSVNITPTELMDPALVETLLELLQRHQLPAQQLCLEVTETQRCPHQAQMIDTTARLRLHGIRLALDDFGTGHASLLQLIQSPFTTLKIDQRFVRQMLESPRHMAAVEASLSIARHLKLKSVAEGVEQDSQAQRLQEMGCDTLQGFLYSPALSQDAFVEWVAVYQRPSHGMASTAQVPSGQPSIAYG